MATATARSLGLVRHGRLTAHGAPSKLDFLNGEWERCDREPHICDRPHFVRACCVDSQGCAFEAHLFYTFGHWYVTPGAAGGAMILCGARSDSLSPTTVDAKQWHHPGGAGEPFSLPELEFVCEGPNTEEEPFLMEVRPPSLSP